MSGVHLLLGPEQGEKQRHVETLIAAVAKKEGSPPEVHKLFPFDTSMVEVVALLQNGGLFASHRVVVIHDVDQVKGQSEIGILADYCASPSQDATLIMLSDAVRGVSTRIDKTVPKSNKRIFWELFENRKQDWVRSFFRKHEIRITTPAVELILEMVENNTRELEIVCGRLASYFGAGATLERETIEGFLYHDRQENPFTLFDRMKDADLEGSLEVLDKILLSRESEPIGILAALVWQVRKAHGLAELMESGHSPAEAFSRLQIRSKRAQALYQQAVRLFTADGLTRMLVLLEQCDREVRLSRSDLHPLLLQLFLLRALPAGSFRS